MNIERVKIMLEEPLKQEELTLYDLKFEKEGQDHYLRVFVDKDEGKVTLDEIVAVSEKISLALDEDESIKDGYILDVSSAGAEKLIQMANIERHNGKYIKIKLNAPIKGQDSYTGTLLSVDEKSLTLQINLKGRITKVVLDKDNITQINQAIKF
jgi:ribosome maturation factor RimP